MTRRFGLGVWLLASLTASGPGRAAGQQSPLDPVDQLMSLRLEDLMGVRVNLATRSEQPVSATAAAVHITPPWSSASSAPTPSGPG